MHTRTKYGISQYQFGPGANVNSRFIQAQNPLVVLIFLEVFPPPYSTRSGLQVSLPFILFFIVAAPRPHIHGCVEVDNVRIGVPSDYELGKFTRVVCILGPLYCPMLLYARLLEYPTAGYMITMLYYQALAREYTINRNKIK